MKNITKYRVYYSDTDHAGAMYYANSMKLFEIGRTEFLREFVKPFSEYEKEGKGATVVEAHVEYKKPIKYDDELEIETTIGKIGNTSIRFDNKILHKGEIMVSGYCVLVFIKFDGPGVFSKMEVPEEIRKLK